MTSATAYPIAEVTVAQAPSQAASQESEAQPRDIEHADVVDDPREWSKSRKLVILSIIAIASMIATLGANIYNPAIPQIQSELHASDAEIALSLSLFIIFQGVVPLFWSAASEIKGRKTIYIVSVALFIAGCIIVATSKTIGLVIGMRCVQAAGASAVLAIGAATLADIFEPRERGTMMGIYYAAPLLGPSLGPIAGGILTQLFNWRAVFYFLAIFGVFILFSFILLKDTFRRERSLAYQAALRRAIAQAAQNAHSARKSEETIVGKTDKKKLFFFDKEKDAEAQKEQASVPPSPVDTQVAAATRSVQDVKLSIRDINPIAPLIIILRRWNNVAILFASGFFFAFGYSISYTCSRTLSMFYGYNALKIGFVLLSFGLGCMGGSILGGRWSDKALKRLREKNGGQGHPEMRLQSTIPAMALLPLSSLAYAWICQERVHVSAVCISLFFSGFFAIWIYSSTLAYIVDANVGRSSTAVATNSAFRGVAGFIFSEVAVPLQIAIGDGGLYTLWAGLMLFAEGIILLVIWRGGKWRMEGEAREARQQQKQLEKQLNQQAKEPERASVMVLGQKKPESDPEKQSAGGCQLQLEPKSR